MWAAADFPTHYVAISYRSRSLEMSLFTEKNLQQAKIRDKKTHTQTQCSTSLCVMAIANKHILLIATNIFLSLTWLIAHTTDIVDLLEKIKWIMKIC